MDRRKILKNVFLGVFALHMALGSLAASAGDFGLSAKGGTLGLGLELDYKLTNKISLRAQAQGASYSDELEEDGNEYDGEVDLSTYGLLVDWHPWGRTFRLSVGAFSNGNEIGGSATGLGQEYEIGDRTYISDDSDPVTLDLAVELGSGTVPYVGFGWGNSPENDGGFMFSFDVGFLLSGSPEVILDVSGSAEDTSTGFTVDLEQDQTALDEINAEIDSLEDEFSDFDIFPAFMFGVGYRF